MDIEFHYYVTYLIAKRAGFNNADSYTIAYSSQYVDDNCFIITANKGKKGEFTNYISQTMDITKPKNKLMRIYPCFHFIPGDYETDTAKRRDGKMHLLNATPNSDRAKEMFSEALKSKNLYRIGIATHSYADTWAHQNFVGYFDYFNAFGGLLDRLVPNVGHADAKHNPDIPSLIWEDKRLISDNFRISNKTRFLEAAEIIFKKFRKYNDKKITDRVLNKEWKQLEIDIATAIGGEFKDKKKNKKVRLKRYKKLLKKELGKDSIDYKEDSWFDKAVDVDVRGLPDRWRVSFLHKVKMLKDDYTWNEGYRDSDWYGFQESVVEHQHLVENLCKDIFDQLELDKETF